MPDPVTTTTTPAAEPQTPASTTTAPTVEEFNALKAQLDDVGKKLGEVSKEAAERRVAAKKASDEAATSAAAALEAKKAAGELGPVLAAREAELTETRAELAKVKPLVDRYEAVTAKKKTTIETALQDATLPNIVKRGIEIALRAGEIDDAADLLAEHRASVTSVVPPKQPAPPAPAQGAAPSTPAVPLNLKNPSVADLEKLKASNPAEHARIIHGQKQSVFQSVAARLTGAGARK